MFKVVFVNFKGKQSLTFFMTKLFFIHSFRVSLEERLQHEERPGVIRSTGSALGEKEITFQVKKVRRLSICYLLFTSCSGGKVTLRAKLWLLLRFFLTSSL